MRKFNPFLHRTYKPLLHKKGKQWIVIGLSALSLIGLGSAFNFNAHASTNTVKNNINTDLKTVHIQEQPVQNQNNTQTHPESNTANITKQANNLHSQIINNNTKVNSTSSVSSSKLTQSSNANLNDTKKASNLVSNTSTSNENNNSTVSVSNLTNTGRINSQSSIINDKSVLTINAPKDNVSVNKVASNSNKTNSQSDASITNNNNNKVDTNEDKKHNLSKLGSSMNTLHIVGKNSSVSD